MKTKILSFLLVLVLLSIYPAWRYFNNAQLFADAIFGHVSKMGNWTHGSVSSSLSGKLTVRNVIFKPKNYTQSLNIDSIVIQTTPMFLLKTSPNELTYVLPESLSISANTIALDDKSNDIFEAMEQKNLWMMLIGYAGSFGCTKDMYTSFESSIWNQIIKPDQIFNADLYFSRQIDGSLDADLILDAENMFSSTWSSNLKSSYNEDQIVIDELLVDKLYYSYLDNGFNIARNNACIQNYKSSFAAYRLSSAEHVQQYLRINYSKELPNALINWYQRNLAPDTEYNAIINLENKKFISDLYNTPQKELFENSTVEVSTNMNEYLPVSLKEIDYTKIDTSLLISENTKKQQQADLNKEKQSSQEPTGPKTTVVRTGSRDNRMIAVSNLQSVVNQRLRIKTVRGRPINGILKSVGGGLITLDSTFKTGTSTITIPIDKISSVELL
ncbi:MAG: hypothetical protein AB8B80_10540 [Marinicellaceae bacterium]